MNLPITPIIDLCNSIICAYCSYRLFRSYHRDRQAPVLLYFAQGYASLIIAYLMFSIPRIAVPEESFVLGVSFIISQSFLYLAIAFFAKVGTFFINVQMVQRAFWSVVILSTIVVLFSIVYFSYPIHDLETGITDWNIHPFVGIGSFVIFAGVLLPSAVLFFRQGLRSQERIVKIRSTVIAGGLILLIITAFTYYTATSEIVALTSDLLSLLSFLIIFFGVIYKRGSNPPPPDQIVMNS
ncbi:MAG: hypothetical protein WC505_04555 [Patescibacteria group bacterium]